MNPGEVFRNKDGQDCTVLDSKNDYTLVSCKTEMGIHFSVVKGISQLESGNYNWDYGRHFMDIISAARYLDNPERGKARMRVGNERKR